MVLEADKKVFVRSPVFTTGLDENNQPVNTISRISMQEGRIYIYMKWKVPPGKHLSGVRIWDGWARLVYQHRVPLRENEEYWNTWFWKDFEPHMDKPGNWRFAVFLDDDKVFEDFLQVTK